MSYCLSWVSWLLVVVVKRDGSVAQVPSGSMECFAGTGHSAGVLAQDQSGPEHQAVLAAQASAAVHSGSLIKQALPLAEH